MPRSPSSCDRLECPARLMCITERKFPESQYTCVTCGRIILHFKSAGATFSVFRAPVGEECPHITPVYQAGPCKQCVEEELRERRKNRAEVR